MRAPALLGSSFLKNSKHLDVTIQYTPSVLGLTIFFISELLLEVVLFLILFIFVLNFFYQLRF